MRRTITLAAACATASLLIGAGSATAAETSVTDPRNDTEMQRNGPDVIAMRVEYTQQIAVQVTYDSAADVAMATNGGTITGATLEFANGKSYLLQRKSADPGFGTPLVNEIIVSNTSARIPCPGLRSSVSTQQRAITVSAPTSCFAGGGTKLRARGVSFTRNFDVDETAWSKWIPMSNDECVARDGIQSVACRASWVQLTKANSGVKVKPFPAGATVLINWGATKGGKAGFKRCAGACTLKLAKGSWWVNAQIRETPTLLASRAGIRPLVVKR